MQKRVIGYIDGLAAESYTSRNNPTAATKATATSTAKAATKATATSTAKATAKTAATSTAKTAGEAKTAKTRGGKSSFGKAVKFAVVCMLLVFSVFCAIGSADWIISQQVKFEGSSESYFNFDEAALQAHINIKAGEATTQSQSARAQKAAKNTAGVSTAKAATNYSAKTSSASSLYAANDENAATYANDENGAATYANESETSAQIGRATYNGAELKAFVVTSGVANAAGELPEEAIKSALTTKYVKLNSESDKLPENIKTYFEKNATEGMPSAAGTYAIYVTINGFDGTVSDQKDLGFAVKIFTITPCPVAIAWSDSNTLNTLNGFTYDGTAHTDVTATATVNTTESGNTVGAKANVTVGYDITRNGNAENEIKNAGEYTLTAKLTGDNAGNYTITSGETTKTTSFTVAKAALTVTANNKQITYGDNPPSFSVSYSGFVNGEDSSVLSGKVAFECGYERGSKVGTYTITPSGLTSENYAITFKTGTLTVKPYGVKIEWSKTTVTYNGEAQSPTAEISNKIADLPAPELTLSPASATEAGTYTVTASLTGEHAGNYTIASGETTSFVINKKAVEITITDKDITYGDDAPTSYSYTFGEGTTQEEITLVTQNIKFSCSYTKGSNAGKYDVTASVSIANYDIKVTPGTLTVNRAGLTLKANNGSVTYGEEPDANGYGYTLSDFRLNDTEKTAVSEISVSYTYNYKAGSSDVGNYTITPKADKFTSTNYEIKTINPGTLTVKQASVTVNTLIQKDYADGGVLFDGSLFSFSKEVNGGITVDLSNATAKNFTSGTASETAGLFEYSYGSGKTYIKAGSTYVISGVKFESKNYNVTNANADIYLKYKTAKVGSTYYTIEDALSQSGDITLAGDSSSAKSYVITAFSKLGLQDSSNFKSYTRDYKYSLLNTLIVPHKENATDKEKIKSTGTAYGNVYAALIVPQGITIEATAPIKVTANIGYNQEITTTRAKEHGVLVNNGTITTNNSIDCYGYIKGSGLIKLTKNAEMIDVISLYDFPGGTAGSKMCNSVFPSVAFSIHNNACDTEISAGAEYKGYVYVVISSSLGVEPTQSVCIVGKTGASQGLFTPTTDNGYILKKVKNKEVLYDIATTNQRSGTNEQVKHTDDIEIFGDYKDNNFVINLDSIKSISFEATKDKPIPLGLMNVTVKTGSNLSLTNASYTILPDATLKVEKGATLSLGSGVSIVAMPKTSMPTSGARVYTKYSKCENDGKLIVNGKLDGSGSLGGCITTEEAGAIISFSNNYAVYRVMYDVVENGPWYKDGTEWATGLIWISGNEPSTNSNFSATNTYKSDGAYWYKTIYNITYDTQGGTLPSNAKTIGTSGEAIGDLPIPTKLGYKFDYWTYNGNQIHSDNLFYYDVNLIAHWTAKEYTINFVFENGQGSLDSQTFSGNTTVSLPQLDSIVVNEQTLSFAGWYKTKTYTDNAISTVGAVDADDNNTITIYAKFSASEPYKINYKMNPQELDFIEKLDDITDTNEDYNKLILLDMSKYNNNTDFNFAFLGWYSDENFENKVENIDGATKTLTLYAKWEAKKKITITNSAGYKVSTSLTGNDNLTLDVNEDKTFFYANGTNVELGDVSCEDNEWSYNESKNTAYKHKPSWSNNNTIITVSNDTQLIVNAAKDETYYMITFTLGKGSESLGSPPECSVVLAIPSECGYDLNLTPITSVKLDTSKNDTNKSCYIKAGTEVTATKTNCKSGEDKFTVNESTTKPYVGDDGSCLVEGTLITLADGTRKKVEDITENDTLLVFNHYTGKYDYAKVLFNDHVNQAKQNYKIINLYFSNNKVVKVVYEHGFFDLDENKYVYITENNYLDYVGHRFYSATWNGTTYTDKIVTLDKATITEEYVKVYSPVTEYHMNYFTEDMLSMPGGIEGIFNIFEYGEGLKFDEELMQKDIEQFGEFTYEDFKDLVPESIYNSFQTRYFTVAIGKGNLTMDRIKYYIDRYGPLMT